MVLSVHMSFRDFPKSQYLARIGLSKVPEVNEEGLREVHAAQSFSIPFENIDVLLRRAISLEPDDLISKLLNHRRGGYCFELNGLLHLALKSFGFKARALLARVLYGLPDPSARTHQVLIVTIEGRDWLADCGFGGPGLCLPLPIVPDRIEEQYGESYRLRQDARLGWVLQKASNEGFIDLYSFDDGELTLENDIEMANHYTSTWPASIFRLHRMCSLRKTWGRVTLSDMELNIYREGQNTSRTLPPGPQYMSALAEHFGIYSDAKYEDLSSGN
jgi:N-hydroxyarylamine O-acetyltransferase